jgi:hypothetical protein
MRLSIGDFNFDASTYLETFQNHLYWATYLMGVFLLNIIFMNFIIAEVGATYSGVIEILHVKLLQEQGELINEAEDMMRTRFSEKKTGEWNHLFPKYLIKRELDE